MSQQPPLSLFVKLAYWDVYRLNVVLTASAFRKVLYIWGFVALLWLSLSVFLLVRPSATRDWAVMLENARPLEWAFALPVVFVFVLPLLSAQRVLRDDLIKRGSTTNSRRLEFTSRPPSQNPIYHGLQFVGSESSLRNFWYSPVHALRSRFPKGVSRGLKTCVACVNCFALTYKGRSFATTQTKSLPSRSSTHFTGYGVWT
jgi:hypothetical protein